MPSEDLLLGLLGAVKTGEGYLQGRRFQDELARAKRKEDREEERYGLESAERRGNRLQDIEYRTGESEKRSKEFGQEFGLKQSLSKRQEQESTRKSIDDQLGANVKLYETLTDKQRYSELSPQERRELDRASNNIRQLQELGRGFFSPQKRSVAPSVQPPKTPKTGQGGMMEKIEAEMKRRSERKQGVSDIRGGGLDPRLASSGMAPMSIAPDYGVNRQLPQERGYTDASEYFRKLLSRQNGDLAGR